MTLCFFNRRKALAVAGVTLITALAPAAHAQTQ